MSAVDSSRHTSALVADLVERAHVIKDAYGRDAAIAFVRAMAPLLEALGAVAVPSNVGPATQPGYADLFIAADCVLETAAEVRQEIMDNCAMFASPDEQCEYVMAMNDPFTAAEDILGKRGAA